MACGPALADCIGAVLSAAGAWVAAQSGEALLVRVSQVRSATTDFDLVRHHTDAGYRVRIIATIFMVVVLAATWLLKPSARDDVGAAHSRSSWRCSSWLPPWPSS